MSLMYRFPRLYNMSVHIIHGRKLNARYELIAQEVGENKRVFELGCGTCLVVPFLHKNCSYQGWDLNDAFIRYNQRRNIRVEKKNIFDFEQYPENDVIVICDVLHHIVPNHIGLLKEALKKTEKLIVSEPARSFKLPRVLLPIGVFISKLVGDYDGINPADTAFRWDYHYEALQRFYQSLGCVKTLDIGWDMIGVFERSSPPEKE